MRSVAYSIATAVALACVFAAPAFAAQASFYQLPSGAFPHDVAPAPDGTVWYSGQERGFLGRFDPKTGKNEEVPLGPGAAPHGVIIGPDGAPWVTEGGQNAIARVDPATRAVKLFPLPKERRNANLNTATFDHQGVLWFTGQNGVYGRLDPKSGTMAVFDAPRGTGPYGIATTPDGQVFFASLASNYLGQIDLDRVTNWSEYDAALRQRGSLTVWFTEEAIAAWRAEPRTTRGGQPHYSALAITTALTLRAVFRLALRQTEGLIGSVIRLLGLDLAIPDHSTLSRRAETLAVAGPPSSAEPVHLLVDSTGLKLSGAGEWSIEKHGTSRRRSWRKLHIGVDADTGRIVAAALTTNDVDDGSQVGPLLDQIDDPIASLTGDGAYDQDGVYGEVAARHPDAAVIVPPRSSGVPSETAKNAPTPRDRHLQAIAEHGRMGWQKASGYNWRALVEADIGRWKRVIGHALRSQTNERQAAEVAIAVDVLNRMLELGRPSYVRIA